MLTSSYGFSQGIIKSKINETNPVYLDIDPDSYKFERLKQYRELRDNNDDRYWDKVESEEGITNNVRRIVITATNILLGESVNIYLTDENKVSALVENRWVRSTSGRYEIERFWDNKIASYYEISKPEKKYVNETIKIIHPDVEFNIPVSTAYLFKLTREDQPVDLYSGYYQTQDTIRNRRGLIRSIKKGDKVGFTVIIPTEKKSSNESKYEVNGGRIGRGFFRAYLKSGIGEYIEKETWETYSKNPEFTISNLSAAFFNIEDGDDPNEYSNKLGFISNMLYNMYGVFQIADITFTSLEGDTIAVALGINDNCSVNIAVDIDEWNKASYLQKYHIMFHELGHDIFNLTHSDGIRLMATNQFDIESEEEFGEMIHEMLYHVVQNYDVVGVGSTSFICDE
tara:strand:+ start:157 stop:1350 length:1194 start_codon:yes stop_codon:yes gene_type:complete